MERRFLDSKSFKRCGFNRVENSDICDHELDRGDNAKRRIADLMKFGKF